MKRKILFIIPFVFVLGVIFVKFNGKQNETEEVSGITKLREKHKYFLDNSPYKDTKRLSKKERKAKALPPNGYFEQLWERTLDPNLGYPNTKGALKIQHDLIAANKNKLEQFGVPGQNATNAWVERGPSNVAGRTRGLLFDPNDPNNQRVFAGGVSGGLWVNNNITDANSVWTLVPGVPENIAVNEFAVDPNNSNIIYIGSGESYVGGDAIGNGVYRSIDGGVNWDMIFGGPTGTSSARGNNLDIDGIFYVNDIITRDVMGRTEVYFAAALGLGGADGNPIGILGPNERGIYRSTDNGDSWTQISITGNNGSDINPNDLELDVNNNIWLATTGGFGISSPGGEIFMSSDGINFTSINTIPGGNVARTEIEPSSQDPNVFYIAVNQNNSGNLYVTTDAFSTIQVLNEPDDADTSVTDPGDYTRGQAFYDLPIEVDPTDDTILYIGGVNSFRGVVTVDATDGTRSIATSDWMQMSRQGTGFVPSLNISVMHADIHSIVFHPTDPNQAIFGTDGGVYYGSDLLDTPNSTTAIQVRNNNYNVTQFYAGDINDVDGTVGGGTQDNSSPINLTGDASVGVEPFFSPIGGDGAYGQFDDDGDYMIISTQNINYFFIDTPITGATTDFGAAAVPTVAANGFNIVQRQGGNFVNEADVDTNLDILYINATLGGTDQIGRYTNIELRAPVETLITDPLLTNEPSAFQVSPFTTTSTTLLVGTDQGDLLRVTNADGASGTPVFEDITGANFVGSISDIEFVNDENTIMVTMFNYGVDSIFYTEDAGVTWVSKEGNLVDIPLYAILESPFDPNEVIVGTQFGVFRTDNFLDASPNWVQSFNGMSNVPVRDLDLRPSTNEVLATTFGRGMFIGQFTDFDPNADDDGDGILNGADNCPDVANTDQADADGNGIGDVCQDTDNDGILDINDNCPTISNPGQEDANGDGIGDACQDSDGDGVMDDADNCINNANAGQEDFNNDGIGDACQDTDGDGIMDDVDNCQMNANPGQEDADGNGIGDICEDTDGDGIADINDNCPAIANPGQEDFNNDGIGDVCQDTDGDGVMDDSDNCQMNANPGQEDTNGNGVGDACDTSFEAPTNINIQVVAESCPGLDNGTITISTVEQFVTYTATIDALGLANAGFTDSTSFEDLPVGNYRVCVSVDDRNFETCFEITINAAPALDIDFTGVLPSATFLNSQIFTFSVAQGTGPFEVRFNNELIRTTNESTIEVELTGSGLLEIIPLRLCEGIFEFEVESPVSEIRAFPNPVVNELNVSIPGDISSVGVSVYNITGQLVYQDNPSVSRHNIRIPFTGMSTGVYFVSLDMGEAPVVLKIIK